MDKVNLKTKVVCVYDAGLFMFICERLARDFKHVYLFTDWKSDYPKSQDDMIGTGIPNVTRVSDFWEIIDEIDLFVFPGLYNGDIQLHLEKLGKRVFGSRQGDRIERFRGEANELFKKLGLSRPEVKTVIGTKALRNHLKEHDDRYVKINEYRGDHETWHSKTYEESEETLDKIDQKLSKSKHDYEFLIESPISGKDVVEFGYDGYSIDGQFPNKTVVGYEKKDVAWAGKVKTYKEFSPLIKEFNDKISKTLADFRYRNFFHTEGRCGKDKDAKIIDITCRFGSPPSEVMCEMLSNLDEIMWYGSEGILIQPVYEARYGIEIMIDSSDAENTWQSVRYPKSINRWVKLRNYAIINDIHCVIPKYPNFDNVGAVVAIGDSLDDCIEKVKKYADQVSGSKIEINTKCIGEIKEVIDKGKKIGIEW